MTDTYRPYTLIAELTYRCPLRCPYCSNAPDHAPPCDEIDGATWRRVLREAEALGVVQVHLTGGEPLLRNDLEAIVEQAGRLDLYANLITSGIPLSFERLARLKACGLRGVQVSIQSAHPPESDRIAGIESFHRKLDVLRWVKTLDLPLTINVVLHRDNLDAVDELIGLAEQYSADRLELANVQYLGWALRNRAALLPGREQVERARRAAATARARLRGRMEVVFVTPDYYSDFPKSCLNGWGRRFIVVNPEGLALPCHLAHTLPGWRFENVAHARLDDIWHRSPSFNRFRGDGWLPDPCRSCDRRGLDFGGCRCQAFHLAGDPGAVDPACVLSPDHGLIEAARRRAERADGAPVSFEYRSGRKT